MSGKLIGYIRVSTLEQSTERQLEGIKLDKCFTDKASGKSVERPALQELLSYVRDGDTIIVHSMDRLARNLDDLRQIVKALVSRQVKVKFIKESLEFTGEDSPISNLLLSVMGAFAEFERTLIKERQMEGIELAKKRGVYKGRKPALSNEQVMQLTEQVALGNNKSQLAKELGISRETLYKYLRTTNCSEQR
jgi:DNA invertase Pin-like site-specific DNA recombinase